MFTFLVSSQKLKEEIEKKAAEEARMKAEQEKVSFHAFNQHSDDKHLL